VSVAVVPWAAEGLRRFVTDARVTLVLLLHPSGRVVGQHGFVRSVDVMSACALAAAINATGAELGRMLDGAPFRELHHAGAVRQLFLAAVPRAPEPLLCLAVFDRNSSLGIVRLYFEELSASLAAVAPPIPVRAPALPGGFENELNRNLAALFGRG
jgi:hypothetical protein